MLTGLRKFPILLPMALTAAGCVSSGKLYVTPTAGTAKTKSTDEAEKVRAYIVELKKHYSDGIDGAMTEQRWIDIPLIGLAAGTLASVVYKGSKDLTIGLGLATGAVGAYRVYVAPQTRVQANLKGLTSTDCVNQNFEKLLLLLPTTTNAAGKVVAKSSDDVLADDKGPVASDIGRAENAPAVGQPSLVDAPMPDNITAATAATFSVAQSALKEAVASGKAALRIAKDASSAVIAAPDTADTALAAVQSQFVRIVVTGTQDLAAARAELLAGAVSAAQLSSNREGIRSGTLVLPQPDPNAAPAARGGGGIDNNAATLQTAQTMSDIANRLSSSSRGLADRATRVLTINETLKGCSV